MGDTNISWVARPRTTLPLTDARSVRCVHPEEACLDVRCARCWEMGFTVNPWHGCVEKTRACSNCYAKAVATDRMGLDVWGKSKPRNIRTTAAIKELRRIHNRALRTGQAVGVFSGSMCDVFEDHEAIGDAREFYLDAARTMLAHPASKVDLMLLTKRPENVARMVPWLVKKWPARIWLGATIATADDVDQQIADDLARLKSDVGMTTFASVEPMLDAGPVIGPWLKSVDLVIIGGESGNGARPFDVDAAHRLVDAAHDAGAKVWFKQMGSVWASQHGGALVKGASHGQDPYRWPEWARLRELPGS